MVPKKQRPALVEGPKNSGELTDFEAMQEFMQTSVGSTTNANAKRKVVSTAAMPDNGKKVAP